MRSVPRRRLIAGLLAAPLLAGCFASNDDTSSEGSADGARLRVALAFPPAENFSPYGADATLLSRLGVTEGLTKLDANGAAAPALAASWKKESDSSWLFTLREAEFQDGGRVTPSAVATALKHAGEAKPVTAALSGVSLTAKAVGDTQVRITTENPDPALPLRLSSPGLAVLSGKAYGKERVDPAGTATGPFELTDSAGATKATLDRFDGYWGGRAQAAGIDARFIADGTARTNALRTDDVDIAEAVPASQTASLDKNNRRETATARTTALQLNTSKGAFKDAGLRSAVREAVDGSKLADGVYEGHADPGAGIFGPALTWAEGKRVEPTGRAGAKDPKGTAITLATYDNRPELPEAAQVLKEQLQKAGFKVRIEVRESSRIEGDALAGKFDAFLGARNTMLDTGDPVSVLASDYTSKGSYNLSLLSDKKVDAAVRKAEKTGDIEQRQDAAMAAEAAILGTDATVPLVHQRIVTGVGSSVEGVVLDPYERALVGTGTRR
ncbi:Glutathione-binding protein GsiB precursor [Streptomyces sp. YIM 130001]|uniref:ABC transporter substrate-binding protein n=1 Tax=Streptomyces sp. YIM 130001 TaxID=2259644 RepID=UPI000E65D7BA|nr:ABC transporter substrate-binding protein [Streptomyces sp. YIM 130001]RII11210.1 Glutathione-binding protein GsiB precursor [Streptomyces sp. YIM 130001]